MPYRHLEADFRHFQKLRLKALELLRALDQE